MLSCSTYVANSYKEAIAQPTASFLTCATAGAGDKLFVATAADKLCCCYTFRCSFLLYCRCCILAAVVIFFPLVF